MLYLSQKIRRTDGTGGAWGASGSHRTCRPGTAGRGHWPRPRPVPGRPSQIEPHFARAHVLRSCPGALPSVRLLPAPQALRRHSPAFVSCAAGSPQAWLRRSMEKQIFTPAFFRSPLELEPRACGRVRDFTTLRKGNREGGTGSWEWELTEAARGQASCGFSCRPPPFVLLKLPHQKAARGSYYRSS